MSSVYCPGGTRAPSPKGVAWETGYTYDLLDRQVTMTFQDGSTRTNVYDFAGDVVTYTDENGSVFASDFDPLGRRYQVDITPATGRMITKRYLAGGINSDGLYYNNSSALVGVTTAYDLAGNKAYERSMHAEERSSLYLPIPYESTTGYGTPLPAGYDSLNRLQQYQRGTLAEWRSASRKHSTQLDRSMSS